MLATRAGCVAAGPDRKTQMRDRLEQDSREPDLHQGRRRWWGWGPRLGPPLKVPAPRQ